MQLIRLLIADDHPVVRTGLHGMLTSQPDFVLVGQASTGLEAVELVAQLQPDVVLMDLQMPGMDGVTAIKQISAQYPHARVLVLTTFDSDADIWRAIDAGATGYLLKDVPRDELYRAIRAAARGEALLAPAIAARVMNRMRAPGQEALRAREIEVLALVAQGANNKQIGRSLHISEATVKSHLVHIFGKLGVADRTAAVTVATQRGILRL